MHVVWTVFWVCPVYTDSRGIRFVDSSARLPICADRVQESSALG
jgi:hypothetical protein